MSLSPEPSSLSHASLQMASIRRLFCLRCPLATHSNGPAIATADAEPDSLTGSDTRTRRSQSAEAPQRAPTVEQILDPNQLFGRFAFENWRLQRAGQSTGQPFLARRHWGQQRCRLLGLRRAIRGLFPRAPCRIYACDRISDHTAPQQASQREPVGHGHGNTWQPGPTCIPIDEEATRVESRQCFA